MSDSEEEEVKCADEEFEPVEIINYDKATNKGPKIEIPFYLPNVSNGGFIAGLVGSRGSGKSNLLINLFRKEMMGKMFKPQHVILFSPSIHLDDSMADIPAKWKFEKYSNDIIEDICTQQKNIKAQYGKKAMPNILIVFDDCILESSFKRGSCLEMLCYRGRHLHISCIFSVQKWSAVSRGIRLNTTHLIVFEPTNGSEKDFIINEYATKDDRKSFKKLFDAAVREPYSFLYINHLTKNREHRYMKKFEQFLNIEDF